MANAAANQTLKRGFRAVPCSMCRLSCRPLGQMWLAHRNSTAQGSAWNRPARLHPGICVHAVSEDQQGGEADLKRFRGRHRSGRTKMKDPEEPERLRRAFEKQGRAQQGQLVADNEVEMLREYRKIVAEADQAERDAIAERTAKQWVPPGFESYAAIREPDDVSLLSVEGLLPVERYYEVQRHLRHRLRPNTENLVFDKSDPFFREPDIEKLTPQQAEDEKFRQEYEKGLRRMWELDDYDEHDLEISSQHWRSSNKYANARRIGDILEDIEVQDELDRGTERDLTHIPMIIRAMMVFDYEIDYMEQAFDPEENSVQRLKDQLEEMLEPDDDDIREEEVVEQEELSWPEPTPNLLQADGLAPLLEGVLPGAAAGEEEDTEAFRQDILGGVGDVLGQSEEPVVEVEDD